MPLRLELDLTAREADRVFVAVWVSPEDEPAPVLGVALQLQDRLGNDLGPRVLLPIAGTLVHAVSTEVELRDRLPIPEGSHVIATAWWDTGQLQATCPTDPSTTLQSHLDGSSFSLPHRDEIELTPLSTREKEQLVLRFPWIASWSVPLDEDEPHYLETETETDPTTQDLASDLGVSSDDAEWLESLFNEEP